MPRVARGGHEQVVAHVLVAVVRRVGLGEDDPTRRAHALGGTAVERGNVVLLEFRAERRAQAPGRFKVFDRNGYPMQCAEGRPAHDRVFSCPRGCSSRLNVHRYEGKELRLDVLGTFEHRVQ